MAPIVGWVLKILSLAVAAGGVFFVHKKYKTKPDHVIEEMIEEQIEQETGLDVDLSPDSPEEDKPSKE